MRKMLLVSFLSLAALIPFSPSVTAAQATSEPAAAALAQEWELWDVETTKGVTYYYWLNLQTGDIEVTTHPSPPADPDENRS